MSLNVANHLVSCRQLVKIFLQRLCFTTTFSIIGKLKTKGWLLNFSQGKGCYKLKKGNFWDKEKELDKGMKKKLFNRTYYTYTYFL